MVILDTCALIDLCQDQPSINKKTYHLLEQKGAVILSICFAEIALKTKKKKLVMSYSARELFSHYKQVSGVQIRDIGCEEWFNAIELDWSHKDPVDRLLVAYAKAIQGPIVTSDIDIKKYYKEVIW